MPGGKLADLVVAQGCGPGGVFDGLGDGIAEGLVALEFDDDEVAFPVDGEEVEAGAPGRVRRAADDEDVAGNDVDVAGEPVLEALFEVDGAGFETGGFGVGADVPGDGLFHEDACFMSEEMEGNLMANRSRSEL